VTRCRRCRTASASRIHSSGGEDEFRLHPLPDGGTRFAQSESFTGVLVPLVSGVLEDTRIGFAQMNQAMKRRAVTGPPPATT